MEAYKKAGEKWGFFVSFFLQSNLAASKKQSKAKDERLSLLKPKMKNKKNMTDKPVCKCYELSCSRGKKENQHCY